MDSYFSIPQEYFETLDRYDRTRKGSEKVLTDEGIIEGCEDTGDTKDKFTCRMGFVSI